MIITLVIIVLTAGTMVWGKIRSDIVALISMLSLVLTGIVTPMEGLSGFSNSVVIMIAGLFVVGGAVTKTGIASKISNKVLSFAGTNPYKLFVMVLTVTVLGGFLGLSNTGTVAILMPIVISVAQQSKMSSRLLLMPMAFAGSIGGMMTLIGTPPTLIVHDALINAGYKGLSYFSTLPLGLVMFVIGIFMLWPLSKKYLDDQKQGHDSGAAVSGPKSPQELQNMYRVIDNLYRLELTPNSPLVGKKLSELDLTTEHSVSIVEIRTRSYGPLRKTVTPHLPSADSVITADDVLYVLGDFKDVSQFAVKKGLNFLDASDKEQEQTPPKFAGKFKYDEVGLAEVVVLKNSQLRGRYVKESGLRKNYSVNILSIQRNNNYLLQGLGEERILRGDMLLVQGTWENIARMSRLESDIVVIGQPETEAAKVTRDYKGRYTMGILLLMVLSMIFYWLPPVVSVLLAAVAIVLGRCYRTVEEAYRAIKWESIVLFAAMMPLAIAMENTGLSAYITNGAVSVLGDYSPYAMMAGIMIATSFLTMFISNTATAILFAPIALQAATTMGVNPYPFLVSVTVAASMCFGSPFATPPNAMVMGAGKYSFMDYVKVGLPLQLVFLVVMLFFIPVIFPF
ncbi:MAG: SLC13 family permease [Porphyromonas sp.]|nr:SLC13 family permease [Porphyromonas sp.]